MSTALSITQDNSIKALGDFLTEILPFGIGVYQAQVNRVPQAGEDDFVLMTPIFKERIETNITNYIDGHATLDPEVRIDLQPTKFTIQLDVHGTNSADNIQIITTLWRSDYSVDLFASYTFGLDVCPLYHSDPHQMPFINGEQQYENRWVVDLYMQVNATTTVTQQFADQLEVGVISVEERYPIN